MKKKILIILLILIFKSSPVISLENITGSMNCEIKGQKIVQINEGKHKEFSSVKSLYDTGEQFSLEYSLRNQEEIVKIFMKKSDITKYSKFALILEFKNIFRINNVGISNPKVIEYVSNQNKIKLNNSKNIQMYFSENIIEVKDPSQNRTFAFERYYKNDWNGLISNPLGGLTHHITTFTCINQNDKTTEILEEIKKFIK